MPPCISFLFKLDSNFIWPFLRPEFIFGMYSFRKLAVILERKKNKENRLSKRKTIWFTLPFNLEVNTKIRNSYFLIKIITPPKLCMKNYFRETPKEEENVKNEKIIKTYNRNLLNAQPKINQNKCKCKRLNDCPLSSNCQAKYIVYNAAITGESAQDKVYVDVTERNPSTKFECVLYW